MKIVCFADTHAGVKNYGRIDKETGMNEREVQTLKLLDETVNYAREYDYRIAGRIGAWLFILASDYAYFKVGLELDDDCGITDRRSIYF